MTIFTRTRSLGAIAIMGLSALALTACGSAPTPGSSASGASSFSACAVSDEGSWNDKSFNEAAYGGLKKAQSDLGVKITGVESHSTEDFQPNLEKTVSQKCDVTFAVGFNFSLNNNVLFTVAKASPNAHFVWIDGWNDNPPLANVKPVQYNMAQSSFLAGYLAAAYSTSKVVGTYGGMQIDAVTEFMDGFYNGAKYYEKQSGKPVTVLGWDPKAKTGVFVGDFKNSSLAKSISQGQISQGADVIYPVAGGLFTATGEALHEAGKGVLIGVDKDIAKTQPDLADITLTSVEKRMTTAVFDIIKSLESGTAFDNTAYVGTLANDGTALSDFGSFDSKISADTKSQLDTIKQDIISGKLDPMVTP